MLPFLKILATAATVLFYPPDVVYMNKPDSMVIFDMTNTKTGKQIYSYTAQGWLLSVRTLDETGAEWYSASADYSWRGDTLCVIFSYSISLDHDSAKCIVDANGFPIKEWHYDDMGLVEISTYVYSASGKLIKQLIQNPNPNSSFGDSVIYSYEAGDMLKSSTQYGDSGKVWSYTGFSCDASTRPIRATFFDCDTQCVPTGYYGQFYYSKNAIRNRIFADPLTMNPVDWHQNNNQLFVTSNRPDLHIADVKIFNVSGALVAYFKARNGRQEVFPFSSRLNQIYLLAVNTDRGRFTFKINR